MASIVVTTVTSIVVLLYGFEMAFRRDNSSLLTSDRTANFSCAPPSLQKVSISLWDLAFFSLPEGLKKPFGNEKRRYVCFFAQ